jgi:hypothetical protein
MRLTGCGFAGGSSKATICIDALESSSSADYAVGLTAIKSKTCGIAAN